MSLMGSHLGVAEKCLQALFFTGLIMLEPSRPLRPNNLEERTCLSEEVQPYGKVAQEALYVQIPIAKSVRGLQGMMFSKYSMCRVTDGAQHILHCQLKIVNGYFSHFKSYSIFTKWH